MGYGPWVYKEFAHGPSLGLGFVQIIYRKMQQALNQIRLNGLLVYKKFALGPSLGLGFGLN